MEVSIIKGDLDKVEADVIAYSVTEEKLKEINKKPRDKFEELISNVNSEFKGEFGQTVLIHAKNAIKATYAVVVGLGKENEVEPEKIRKAYSSAVLKIRETKKTGIAAGFSAVKKIKDEEFAKSIVEGILLTNYAFDKYKTEEKDKIKKIENLLIIYDKPENILDAVDSAVLVCSNVNFTRDLINENADVMTTLKLAEIAKNISGKSKIRLTVLDEKQIAKEGLNLLLNVGRGSKYPPRLIILEYNGGGKEKTAIVGKGITFDSGGLNLKPTGSMETMKYDMAGAAVVLGTMKILAELKAKANVVGVIAACENMIGPNAQKPGDVYKSYAGISVEIANTDAEGRLVLADALAYTVKKFKPSRIIDLATLTGAVSVTFGSYVCGLMSNNDKLSNELFEAGQITYERVWRLPAYDEYKDDIKSEIADIKNTGDGRNAGTISGAVFLEKFVGNTPWAHLDIAGVGWLDKPRYYLPKFANGFGVRLLVEFFNG